MLLRGYRNFGNMRAYISPVSDRGLKIKISLILTTTSVVPRFQLVLQRDKKEGQSIREASNKKKTVK